MYSLTVLGGQKPKSGPIRALGENPSLPLPVPAVPWHSLACDGISLTPAPALRCSLGGMCRAERCAGGAHWELLALGPLGRLQAGWRGREVAGECQPPRQREQMSQPLPVPWQTSSFINSCTCWEPEWVEASASLTDSPAEPGRPICLGLCMLT